MTRRELLLGVGGAVLAPASAPKPMRGAFIIMATPYTESGAVDYEDLAREVEFLHRCGVHGMVWPQMASEYSHLKEEERLEGMRVLAKAAHGKTPALVLGIQGKNTSEALEYAALAEELAPDAVIAMPPLEPPSLDGFGEYYRALARVVQRPFFFQTTGGAKGVVPTVEFMVQLAREFPHLSYVKEETNPVLERMQALARQKPPIRAVFSGSAGRGMLYEMRLGFDGTMPGAPYAELYAQIWNLYQAKKREAARDVFSRLLLMINLEQQIPGLRPYVLKKRGVFKTAVSRQKTAPIGPEAAAEIDFNFEGLRPYLKV